MPAHTPKPFIKQNNTLDYDAALKRFPWLVQKDQKCILSPDIDGLLCGLFCSQFLDWEIVGFYDGKIMLLEEGTGARDCIFLDMEILRKEMRSVGHHMNIHALNSPPPDYYEKMTNCANPNLLRGFDRLHSTLGRKYPLAAIHFIMYVLENYSPGITKVKPQGLAPIFFADGVWKILFKYTGNVLDWFDYLHSGVEADWWSQLKQLSVIDLIREIDGFIAELKHIHPTQYGHINLSPFESEILVKTLNLLISLTGWQFKREAWRLRNLKQYQFTKEIYGQNGGSHGNAKFLEIWNKNPISLAMTDGATIQYTLEKPDKLI